MLNLTSPPLGRHQFLELHRTMHFYMLGWRMSIVPSRIIYAPREYSSIRVQTVSSIPRFLIRGLLRVTQGCTGFITQDTKTAFLHYVVLCLFTTQYSVISDTMRRQVIVAEATYTISPPLGTLSGNIRRILQHCFHQFSVFI
ncbi:hypothetical protein KC331_g16 [Hortaea werneckii]|nr:hypothetical protein KC331_g16 [Hortaea werneckii]